VAGPLGRSAGENVHPLDDLPSIGETGSMRVTLAFLLAAGVALVPAGMAADPKAIPTPRPQGWVVDQRQR
jgi:hypothetical protein